MPKSYKSKSRTSKTPRRPFERERLDSELKLLGQYGLKNKREIWRVQLTFAKIRKAARELLTLEENDPKRMFEGHALIQRMLRLGLLDEKEKELDFVLGLTVQKFLERRLQTKVFKMNLARSIHHARVLIRHRHIRVGRRIVNIPSFMVRTDKEALIDYAPNSPFAGEKMGRVKRKNLKKRKDNREISEEEEEEQEQAPVQAPEQQVPAPQSVQQPVQFYHRRRQDAQAQNRDQARAQVVPQPPPQTSQTQVDQSNQNQQPDTNVVPSPPQQTEQIQQTTYDSQVSFRPSFEFTSQYPDYHPAFIAYCYQMQYNFIQWFNYERSKLNEQYQLWRKNNPAKRPRYDYEREQKEYYEQMMANQQPPNTQLGPQWPKTLSHAEVRVLTRDSDLKEFKAQMKKSLWNSHPKRNSKGSRFCRVCKNTHGLIRKFDLMMCRRCIREQAQLIGFKKYR